MKKIFIILVSLLAFKGYSQLKEGQNFCSQNEGGEYFSLSINKKKIFWKNTYYIETINGKKIINGKEYTEIKQEWENKTVDLMHLREENNIVYELDDCCENETIRFNKNFKVGDKWMKVDNTMEYEIISFTGELVTPYCEYKNLLIIQAKIASNTFKFYYLKGIGYVGATVNTNDGKINNKLISCVAPD